MERLLYLMSFRVRPGLPLTEQHCRSGRPFPPWPGPSCAGCDRPPRRL